MIDKVNQIARKVLEIDVTSFRDRVELELVMEARRIAEKIVRIIEQDEIAKDNHLKARLLVVENKRLQVVLEKWEKYQQEKKQKKTPSLSSLSGTIHYSGRVAARTHAPVPAEPADAWDEVVAEQPQPAATQPAAQSPFEAAPDDPLDAEFIAELQQIERPTIQRVATLSRYGNRPSATESAVNEIMAEEDARALGAIHRATKVAKRKTAYDTRSRRLVEVDLDDNDY